MQSFTCYLFPDTLWTAPFKQPQALPFPEWGADAKFFHHRAIKKHNIDDSAILGVTVQHPKEYSIHKKWVINSGHAQGEGITQRYEFQEVGIPGGYGKSHLPCTTIHLIPGCETVSVKRSHRVGEDPFCMYAASHYLEVGEQCKWYRKKNKERAHGLYMNSAEHPLWKSLSSQSKSKWRVIPEGNKESTEEEKVKEF